MQIAGSAFTLAFILVISIAPSLFATATATETKWDATDSEVRALFDRSYPANWREKLAALIYYGNEDWPAHIQAFKCSKNSPSNPQWTTTRPQVMWTHIFCGQISSQNKAQGFHSQSSLTAYLVCVDPSGCSYTDASGNGYCTTVKIRSSGGSWIAKQGGSTMWPQSKDPTTIINMIVQLYNACKPPAGTKILCIKGCNYYRNPNKFDIAMSMDNYGNVISAYPRRSCTSTPQCLGKCSDL